MKRLARGAVDDARRWRLAAAMVTASLTVPIFGAVPVAHACGGFFCNGGSPSPVVQNAERIAFFDHGDGTMSVLVEILFSGDPDRFAWVLPVVGTPTVELGATTTLNRLDTSTSVLFAPSRSSNQCDEGCGGGMTCGAASSSASPPFPPAGTAVDAGVSVLSAGQVGPYDYAVIAVDPGVTDQAATAAAFLQANNYDVTPEYASVLGGYLSAGQNLLAFRMNKTATVGSIRPVLLTYASTMAVIPLRPTAAAARPGMGVLTFVLGPSRAVPVTFPLVELSPVALDYGSFTLNTDYVSLLGPLFDSVGGQAFLTEFAGRSSALPQGTGATLRHQLTVAQGFGISDEELLRAVTGFFGQVEGYTDVYRQFAQPGPFTTLAQEISCGACTSTVLPSFTQAAFLAAVETNVVRPVEHGDELLAEQPYLTRLFTQLDPAEMTVDPAFRFVTNMPDVSNVFRPQLVSDCDLGVSYTVLDDGRAYAPLRLPDDLPAFQRLLRFDFGGRMEIVRDNTDAIDTAIMQARPATVGVTCRAAAGAVSHFGGPTLLLGLSATARWARRRRRSR